MRNADFNGPTNRPSDYLTLIIKRILRLTFYIDIVDFIKVIQKMSELTNLAVIRMGWFGSLSKKILFFIF